MQQESRQTRSCHFCFHFCPSSSVDWPSTTLIMVLFASSGRVSEVAAIVGCPWGPTGRNTLKVQLTTIAVDLFLTISVVELLNRVRRADSGRSTFLKETARSPEWLHVYWKVIPQFVPLTGLHADICLTNRCSTSGARLHFCSLEVRMGKIKTSVTSAYIAWATGKMVSLDRARRKLSFEV